jgi:hypothetical protein
VLPALLQVNAAPLKPSLDKLHTQILGSGEVICENVVYKVQYMVPTYVFLMCR